MKLDKTKKSVDLTEPVYQRIAEEFWGEIPIVSSLPKGERIEDLHIRIMARVKTLGERIAFIARQRFSTPSHVHRAAHYLGISILYHLFCDYGKDGAKGAHIYQSLMKAEEVYESMDFLETVIETAKSLFEAEKLGLVRDRKVKDKLEDIVGSLPENTRDTAWTVIGRAKAEVEASESRWGTRRPGRPKVIK